MAKILSKILLLLLTVIILLDAFSSTIYAAVEIKLEKAYVQVLDKATNHLKYYRENKGEYTYHPTVLMGYKDEKGVEYPVYCIDKELPGAEKGAYYATTENVLKDDRIWRIIKNGYPFKTAADWGLEDNKDVYVITRFAIYCVLGQAKLEYYFAEESDKEAVKMLEGLKKLVDIGNNGIEKQNDNPLSIEKIGDITKTGEFYAQEYKVKSTSDFSEYKISNIDGMPEGGFIANSNGEKKESFSKNEDFFVMIPKNQMDRQMNINVKVEAECKVYLILEGKSTKEGYQNYAVTTGEYMTASTIANFKPNLNTGKIEIKKIDGENKKILAGVEFNLLDENKNVIANKTTDKDGKIVFENLNPGKYTLVENQTLENYILSEKSTELQVHYNETTNIEIENEHKKGNLKIIKIEEGNPNIKIEGVVFDIYSEEQGKVIGTYITNKDGEINLENLRIGKYKIIEKSTNKWYNLSNEENVEIKYGETKEVTIENELKKGQIRVIKVDSENNKIKLKGVKFEVLDKNNNVLETIVTDEKGEALTSKYAVRDYGKLYIKEIETDKNYILNDKIQEVELKENQIKDIIFENEYKKGNLKIYKVDKDNHNIVLGNIEFDLYSEKEGKVIGTYTTDANGEIYIPNLKIGNYKIIEKSTNRWYNLADEISVEVKWNETQEIKVENELKKGQIKVIKVDSENRETKLKGVKFEVLDKNNKVLETIVTDEKGEALTSKYALRDYENLYLKETQTNSNYVLNDKIQEIKLEENQIKDFVFENRKIKGQIKIIKLSENDSKITGIKAGTPLEGVEFEVYDNNDNLVQKLTTGKEGEAITSELVKGIYKIKEVSTQKWYHLNSKTYEAEIKKDGEIVALKITNEAQNPDISCEKIGPDRAEIGKEIEYDISVKNSGNTSLEKFSLVDTIPTDYIRVTKFKTGTYNQNLRYNLYYKTNFSEEEILLMEDLNTQEDYEINFELELADNEIVTEIRLEFEKVDIGFCSNENPHLFAKVNSNLKSEDTFVNTIAVSGNFYDYKVYDNSSWKTLVYKLLPKTGF